MFLSIVIPVYNAEDTIERCLDSIWRQGLPEDDFEVICVDDCSTDKSVEIIERLRNSHPNLILKKNSKNLRAGGARNHGVREAKGEYIQFIDADDFFCDTSLNKVFRYQKEHGLDILMADASRQHEINEEQKLLLNFPDKSVMTGESFILNNSCPFAPTRYFFRRELMVDNSIWFEENCCCEDVDWCVKITLISQTIQYLPIILEVYIINNQSTTAVEHLKFKTVSDKLFAAKRLHNIALTYIKSDKIRDYVLSVGLLYANEGLKYMNSSYAKINIKRNWIKSLANCYSARAHNRILLNIGFRHPWLYALFSNVMSLFVPYLIHVKRMIKKR